MTFLIETYLFFNLARYILSEGLAENGFFGTNENKVESLWKKKHVKIKKGRVALNKNQITNEKGQVTLN